MKVLAEILEREGISTVQASRMYGKHKSYITSLLSRGTVPKADTLAGILDAIGYDLIARSRADGYEFTIPPNDYDDATT